MHVHVYCGDGEAKFWLEPDVALAKNHRLSDKQVKQLNDIVEERRDEIVSAWQEHFSG